jgi:two-component system response regulator YesN
MSEEHDTAQKISMENAMRKLHDLTGLRLWCVEGSSEINDFKDIQKGYKRAKDHFAAYLIAGEDMLLYSSSSSNEPVQGNSSDVRSDTFSRLLIEGEISAVQAYIASALHVSEGKQIIQRGPHINTAVQLMVDVKDMEKNPDYAEVFGPIPHINTLQGLKQHVWRIAERGLKRRQEAEQGYSAHVSFLVEQVRHSYPEELSLKTLSQRLQMHPNYLGQLFQQEVGANFSDYLNQYRIEKATQLLLHTDQKTTDIALSVGYTDSSYFYRQFKKYTGVSPTEMRSMYSNPK